MMKRAGLNARQTRLLVPAFLLSLLSACGGSLNDQVAGICMDAIVKELGDQTVERDTSRLAGLVRDDVPGIVVIESTILVDKGLTSEVSRGFRCRVQTDPTGKTPPSLILLQYGF